MSQELRCVEVGGVTEACIVTHGGGDTASGNVILHYKSDSDETDVQEVRYEIPFDTFAGKDGLELRLDCETHDELRNQTVKTED